MGTINAQHIAATSAMPQNYASKFQNGILRLNWKLISVKRQILKTFKMNTIVGDVQMILASFFNIFLGVGLLHFALIFAMEGFDIVTLPIFGLRQSYLSLVTFLELVVESTFHEQVAKID